MSSPVINTITFTAKSVVVELGTWEGFQVTLEADEREVCADMSVENRVHDVEPADIFEAVGAAKLLKAIGEREFAEWVADNGDFYEALNAIGIERIREWIDDYTSGDDAR